LPHISHSAGSVWIVEVVESCTGYKSSPHRTSTARTALVLRLFADSEKTVLARSPDLRSLRGSRSMRLSHTGRRKRDWRRSICCMSTAASARASRRRRRTEFPRKCQPGMGFYVWHGSLMGLAGQPTERPIVERHRRRTTRVGR